MYAELDFLLVFSLSRLALIYYITKIPICQYLFEKKFFRVKIAIFRVVMRKIALFQSNFGGKIILFVKNAQNRRQNRRLLYTY